MLIFTILILKTMITIRSAREADLPGILTIYNDIILTTTAVYQYEIHTAQMRKEWYAAKLQAGYPVFVAESGPGTTGSGPGTTGSGPGSGVAGDADRPAIVGFSTFGPFRAWQAYKYTVENSVYVAADQRGKGIGKLLLAPLIDTAREMDMHAVIASVDATNAASLHLHASFGFEEVAHFRQVGYKFGRWLDLTFLELLLDTPASPQEG
jgi:L-amino acid N-acyltransferase